MEPLWLVQGPAGLSGSDGGGLAGDVARWEFSLSALAAVSRCLCSRCLYGFQDEMQHAVL